MVEAAHKIANRPMFITAKQVEEKREREIVHISTGATALDGLLGGGVESKSLTEIYGEYRCGKTQLCLSLCIYSQINTKIPGKALYIDTEGAFRPSRLREIAEANQLDPENVLENVTYTRVHNFEQQMACLDHVAALMAEEQYKLRIMASFFILVEYALSWVLMFLPALFNLSAGFAHKSLPHRLLWPW